jgi:biopolymer transport protein ExbD
MFGIRSLQKRVFSGINEINMTPLIDVSLVLVVMLMLATPLAFESSISLREARRTAKAAKEKTNDERIEVRIVSDEDVLVNHTRIAREALDATLRPMLDASTHGIVVVRCDKGVSNGVFVNVLDRAKICGARQIAVTGD